MDKRYIHAAKDVNERLRYIPRIPLTGEERDRRLKELIERRFIERYIAPETWEVIKGI